VVAQDVHHFDESGLAGYAVGVSVGGDDALVDAPGGFDLDVRVVGEDGGEPLLLAVGKQLGPGAQEPADPVERVPGATPVPARLLLQALAAAVQGVPGQGDDVERVMPTSA
jgi:hypothetical protein